MELQLDRENRVAKETANLQRQQMIEANKQLAVDKNIALSIKTGDRNNMES